MNQPKLEIYRFHQELARLNRLQGVIWVWHRARFGANPYLDQDSTDDELATTKFSGIRLFDRTSGA